jgi:single-strand DNA-binding protein
MSNVFTAVCTVTRDCEVRYLQSGAAVLTVNVANNQGFGDKKTTLFIRVSLFGKRAEGNLKDYLVKGQQVCISGELKTNEYQAKDGTMKTSVELNANIIDLVGGKKNEGGQQAAPQQAQRQAAPAQQSNDEYTDDIPF